MFFCISKSKKDNFPYNHQTSNFVISLDEGWTHYNTHGYNIWYKGYLDNAASGSILDIVNGTVPTLSGNFCAIVVTEQGLSIKSDRQRSFPIWYNTDQITNLFQLENTAWATHCISIDNNFQPKFEYFDLIGKTSSVGNSFDHVVTQIDRILSEKTKTFLSTISSPIRVFLSGGIDTALVFSYIQKYTDQFEIVSNLHCDFDYFYLKNHGTLSKLWGYNQIHHWREPCVLASGTPGDEFMARSPTTANLLLLHYGTSIPELLATEEYKNCLHSIYFNNPKYFEMWAEQAKAYQPTQLAEVIDNCSNYNINDWQHWHFGNTLTWTPLRDIEIFKLVASLPLADLKNQIMNSTLSKELICRNNPKILDYLSEQKNATNHMENLTNILVDN